MLTAPAASADPADKMTTSVTGMTTAIDLSSPSTRTPSTARRAGTPTTWLESRALSRASRTMSRRTRRLGLTSRRGAWPQRRQGDRATHDGRPGNGDRATATGQRDLGLTRATGRPGTRPGRDQVSGRPAGRDDQGTATRARRPGQRRPGSDQGNGDQGDGDQGTRATRTDQGWRRPATGRATQGEQGDQGDQSESGRPSAPGRPGRPAAAGRPGRWRPGRRPGQRRAAGNHGDPLTPARSSPNPELIPVTPNYAEATDATCSQRGALIVPNQPAGVRTSRAGSVPGTVTFTYAPATGYAFPAGTVTEQSRDGRRRS